MATRWRGQRSTEAPMDFQFTSRPSSSTKPVWAQSPSTEDDPSTPRKRTHLTTYALVHLTLEMPRNTPRSHDTIPRLLHPTANTYLRRKLRRPIHVPDPSAATVANQTPMGAT